MTSTSAETMAALLDNVNDRQDARLLRNRAYELLGVRAGDSAVDVGCGAGGMVAELVARGVNAIGVDLDEDMLAVARRRWPRRDFRLGSATELPLETGSVDGYVAEKLLHGLPDPAGAIAEAHRVLRPGGRVVVINQDYETYAIDADDAALTSVIMRSRAKETPSAQVARRLRGLLLDAGFTEVTVEVRTLIFTDGAILGALSGHANAAAERGAITQEQADTWLADQRDREAADRLFVAIPMFLVAGQR